MVEEILIAKKRVYGFIVKLRATDVNYRHSKGHLIVIPQAPEKIYNILPSPIFSAIECIKVVWVGKHRAREEHLIPFLQIRKSKVMQALTWLKHNNKLYRDSQLDFNVMNNWPMQFVPDSLVTNSSIISPEDDVETRDTYVPDQQNEYPNDEEVISQEPISVSAMIAVDGDSEQIGPEIVEAIDNIISKTDASLSDGGISNTPFIRYRTSSNLCSSYNDVEYFTGILDHTRLSNLLLM